MTRMFSYITAARHARCPSWTMAEGSGRRAVCDTRSNSDKFFFFFVVITEYIKVAEKQGYSVRSDCRSISRSVQ